MYEPGLDPGKGVGKQITRLATSEDGISFEGQSEILGRPYFIEPYRTAVYENRGSTPVLPVLVRSFA
jgi:hypothetical protein